MQLLKPSFLLIAGSMFLCGCFDSRRNVDVEQPLSFDHAKHVQYFIEGSHKAEKIQFHLVELDEEEAPDDLLDGKCLECHDTWEDIPDCSQCHIIFQDEDAKNNRAQRPCLGCHQTAWTSYLAGIPTIKVCKSCHSEKPRTDSNEEKKLREYIDKDQDIPWVQINTLVDHVHFSHIAHVRFADLACLGCHPQDMTKQSKPPDRVFVFSMSDCMDCHKQHQARNDCLACHK